MTTEPPQHIVSPTMSLLPEGLTLDEYKTALTYAKLASKTYDWDDNQVVKIGLAFFSGIDDVKQQDFTTPNYRRKGRGGSFVDFVIVGGNDDSGLDYTIYEHRMTGDVVLAFRGTEPLSIEDWQADMQQVLIGGRDGQYEAAITLAKELYKTVTVNGKKKLSFTGHSLGGGLATAAALATGGKAIVFCAAGLSTKTLREFELDTTNAHQHITNFNVRECFVSDWNQDMDDTTLGHVDILGLDSKQHGTIYWLDSVSDRSDFIGIPDWLAVVKKAKTLLNHAWHVFTYQLEHKKFVHRNIITTSRNLKKEKKRSPPPSIAEDSDGAIKTPMAKRPRTQGTDKPIITPGESG